MANRNYTQAAGSLEKKVVEVYATIDGNTTSTPIVKKNSVAANGGTNSYSTTTAAWKGLTSVARSAQGKWTLTLEDRFVRLLGLKVTFVAIDGLTSPLALSCIVLADTLATTKTVSIGFTDTVNSATFVDLGTNDRVLFNLTLSDSVV